MTLECWFGAYEMLRASGDHYCRVDDRNPSAPLHQEFHLFPATVIVNSRYTNLLLVSWYFLGPKTPKLSDQSVMEIYGNPYQ